MLRLKRLAIENVGRFVGRHEIDLEGRSQVLQIDAKNLNTGGSSGSAKSTIFNALEYLLDVNEIPATILQSRLTKSSMSVEGLFDFNGQEVTLKRGKGAAYLKVGDTEVKGDSKLISEKLKELLGMEGNTLRRVFHKRQKEGGFFLSLTPKESYAFLSDTLGLEKIAAASDKTAQEQKSIEERLRSLDNDVSRAQGKIEGLRTSRLSLSPPSAPTVTEAMVAELTARADKSLEAVSIAKAEADQARSQLKGPPSPRGLAPESTLENELAAQEVALKQKLDQERMRAGELTRSLESELSALQADLRSLEKAKTDLSLALSEIDKIKGKISHIDSGACPTCNQSWKDQGSEAHKASLIEKAKAQAQIVAGAKDRIASLAGVEDKIASKNEEILASRKADFSEISKEISDLSNKKLEARRSREAANALINQEYSAELSEWRQADLLRRSEIDARLKMVEDSSALMFRVKNEALAQLNSYKSALSGYESQATSLDRSILEEETSLATLAASVASLQSRQKMLSDAARCLKGFATNMFQETLSQVAARATEILSSIPNMNTATITLESSKETKSGVVKDEVAAHLHMDGELSIPIKSLSGGEKTAVDLAVDLAVIELIEDRAGKGLDLFILDEPFDGLDSVCRERCLEMITQQVSKKRIIIVDHSNETKELVSDKITVIRSGDTSRIEL